MNETLKKGDSPDGVCHGSATKPMPLTGPYLADAQLDYISTGSLPTAERVQGLVEEAHALFQSNTEGENSQVYPALARAPGDLFGISIVTSGGALHEAGDVGHEFSIMSVSKPYVFALVCDERGVQEVREKVGVNATGRAFNSLEAIEASASGLTNPMVNAGAIASTSLAPGPTLEDKWRFIHEGLSRFAGRNLSLDKEIYECAMSTNTRNREIASLLNRRGRIYADPAEAIDLYTRQCCLNVTAHDLAVMGATLADGGVNPVTGKRVISAALCHHVLAVMTTAGLYETSGDWLFDIGLPGKSGISGGIVASAPGKGGLGLFAPPLDVTGNSVKGQLAARFLSHRLGLDIFASKPVIKT